MARQMKDSGVEWIGQIPEDWNVARLCDIKSEKKFAIVDGPFGSAISTNDYREKGVPLIRISNLKNGEVSDEDMVYISEELAESVRRSCIGLSDIVFAKTGATIGKCGINRLIKYGILASSCIKISISHKYNCDYFYYIFSTDQFNQALRNTCTGTTRDTINLTPFSKLNVLLPPYCIQNRIASYLDRKCSQIDAIIAKQQQIIEKLKEYKLSVITEAVTKGLDPNVPMKDSGVEWIGMVPEEWRISRIKYICEFNPGTKKANHDVVSYAPMECVKDGYLIKKEIRHDGISTGLTSFEEGDIIMAKVTPCFENGNIAIAKDLVNKFGVGSSELFVFRAKKVNTQWLFYFLRNSIFKKLAEATMTGTGGLKRVSPSFIRDFSLALPPEKEQRRIIEYLDKKCMEIDRVIKYKQSAVEKLGQYKKSLIYEVVTGKMEV